MKKLMIAMLSMIGLVPRLEAKKIPDREVPATVMTAFLSRYPEARRDCWKSSETSTAYEVKFRDEGEKHVARFDMDGTWLVTETKTALKDLPLPVRSTLYGEFADYRIMEIEKIDDPDLGNCYQLELVKDDEDLAVLMDDRGLIMERYDESITTR